VVDENYIAPLNLAEDINTRVVQESYRRVPPLKLRTKPGKSSSQKLSQKSCLKKTKRSQKNGAAKRTVKRLKIELPEFEALRPYCATITGVTDESRDRRGGTKERTSEVISNLYAVSDVKTIHKRTASHDDGLGIGLQLQNLKNRKADLVKKSKCPIKSLKIKSRSRRSIEFKTNFAPSNRLLFEINNDIYTDIFDNKTSNNNNNNSSTNNNYETDDNYVSSCSDDIFNFEKLLFCDTRSIFDIGSVRGCDLGCDDGSSDYYSDYSTPEVTELLGNAFLETNFGLSIF